MKGNKIGALERAPCPRNTKIYIFDKFPTFPHGFFFFFFPGKRRSPSEDLIKVPLPSSK